MGYGLGYIIISFFVAFNYVSLCQRILRWVCDKKRELIKKEGASETEGAITSLDGIAACWDMLLSDRDK